MLDLLPAPASLRFAAVIAFAAAVAGCSSLPASSPPRDPGGAAPHAVKEVPPSGAVVNPGFELVGWRVIACCCPSPCPCRINKKPTHCHGCDHTDIVHIDRGHLGDVKMDDVTYTLVGRGFGESTEGNWVYCYVDDHASEPQVEALKTMLNDTVKSWGAKSPYLAGKFVGLRKVPMEVTVSADRKEYGVKVPHALELKVHAITNPGHSDPVVSTGIMDAFGDRFVHADTLVHKLDDPVIGYSWDLTGRQANYADFVLNQARIDQGGIGWGCWSAHAAFGDKEPYGEQMIGHH